MRSPHDDLRSLVPRTPRDRKRDRIACRIDGYPDDVEITVPEFFPVVLAHIEIDDRNTVFSVKYRGEVSETQRRPLQPDIVIGKSHGGINE